LNGVVGRFSKRLPDDRAWCRPASTRSRIIARLNPPNKDLQLARTMVRDNGEWLLDLGDGNYLATDDEDAVRDLRGPAFVAHSRQTGERDETQVKVE